MKDYTTDTPEFSDVIKVIETSDPVHAEIPNITFRQLFQNTLCNRKLIKNPEFDDSGEVEGITGKESLLNKLVSGIPLVKWMQNVKAGFSLALYVGELVNNCVTDRADLPLSAAQGKVLMDLYTQLYSDFSNYTRYITINGVPSSNDPVGAIKMNWDSLPMLAGMMLQINAGAEYMAIATKLDNSHGAVLIVGYFVEAPIYMYLCKGVWSGLDGV